MCVFVCVFTEAIAFLPLILIYLSGSKNEADYIYVRPINIYLRSRTQEHNYIYSIFCYCYCLLWLYLNSTQYTMLCTYLMFRMKISTELSDEEYKKSKKDNKVVL